MPTIIKLIGNFLMPDISERERAAILLQSDHAILAKLSKLDWKKLKRGEDYVMLLSNENGDADRMNSLLARAAEARKIKTAERIFPIEGSENLFELYLSENDRGWIEKERAIQRNIEVEAMKQAENKAIEQRAAEGRAMKLAHRNGNRERTGTVRASKHSIERNRQQGVHEAEEKARKAGGDDTDNFAEKTVAAYQSRHSIERQHQKRVHEAEEEGSRKRGEPHVDSLTENQIKKGKHAIGLERQKRVHKAEEQASRERGEPQVNPPEKLTRKAGKHAIGLERQKRVHQAEEQANRDR